MTCCEHCSAAEDIFGQRSAAEKIKQYRKKGPGKETSLLLDVLRSKGVEEATLLDIGGGIGAIQHELIAAGAGAITSVDASNAYIKVAREEAQRRGYADRATYLYGDFVDLAARVEPVDIVTLERVICCYPDMEALVGLSAERAGRLYGVVFPRDSWWTKLGFRLLNFGLWLRRNPFRTYIHPTEAVEAVVQRSGLKRLYYHKTYFWQVIVYERAT